MNYKITTNHVCGIDLHAKSMTLCIMDLSGKTIKRKSIECNFLKLIEILDSWIPDITIGVESTYNWYWLIDSLKEQNIPCVLGHALYMKKRMFNKHKNDPVDAHGIAELLRTNRFPIAYDYPKKMRGVRDLLRRRLFFSRRRAGTFTHFQLTLHQEGYIQPLRKPLMAKGKRGTLPNLTQDEDVQRNLKYDLEFISSLDTLLLSLEKEIVQRARIQNRKHFDALLTIPGCGNILALTVLYETHTIERFRTPQRYSSYCRVVKSDNSSAEKNLGSTTNDKIGNVHLKWAFAEICQCMIKNYPEARKWHQEQSKIHGKAGAHARMRHKLAIAIYYMLKHDRVFDIKKFLGIKESQEVNPAHNWMETSRQKSDPSGAIEQLPDSLNADKKEKRSGQPCAQLATQGLDK